MSTLQVANLHLESTGNNRIQYTGSNTFTLVAGGTTVLTANSTTAIATNNDILGQQTIWVPAAAMTPNITTGAASGSAQTATTNIMLKSLDFDSSTAEFAQFAIQMPKGWNEGTIVPQFIWYQTTTSAGAVVWGLSATSFANTDAFTATAFGTNVTSTSTGGTGNTAYISLEASAMTVAGSPTAEEYVIYRVHREPANGSDTLAVDACLLGVKLHYTINAAKDD